MKIVNNYPINQKYQNFQANVHIIDGYIHADNMEHFAKAALRKSNRVDSVHMHYVDCNSTDINTKQMSSLEEKLKDLNTSSTVKYGDFVAIPGLASVSILNLQDRIANVLNKYINLTAQNLKCHKDIILNFLKEIYNYKNYYSRDISDMDKNSQDLEYTYGVIQEINKLVNNGVKVYVPAGHGADSTIKWMAKSEGVNDELYRFVAKHRDAESVKAIFKEADRQNLYDFNLLSLCNAHIVNVKGQNGKNYIFSAKDGFVNDAERGVYNFSPVRSSSGRILGYSYHDTSTVEYPYEEFQANDKIANLCKYVGLSCRNFSPSSSETALYRKLVREGRSTSHLPDRLYDINQVFSQNEIKARKLDMLGFLINNEQNLIFDTNSNGKIIFHKTNCEGSEKPSVVQMWGSCFSTINALKRDLIKSGNSNSGYSYYIQKAEQSRGNRNSDSAEYYYNKALEILHPDKASMNCHKDALKVYEKLYELLKSQRKYSEAKGVANIIIDLKSNEIKNKSVWNPIYMFKQSEIAKYYSDIANYCENEYEYYPAKVCKWAAEELRKSSSYGDKIVQRRVERNQYIGDLYDECH